MGTKIEKIIIPTHGFDEIIDITGKINNIVSSCESKNGIVNISVLGGCASVVNLEMEPALTLDLTKVLEAIIPINKIYQHDNIWHDGNANAHLKSALLGNSLTLPIIDSKIELGNFGRIILIDFDNKSSNKEIIVSVVY